MSSLICRALDISVVHQFCSHRVSVTKNNDNFPSTRGPLLMNRRNEMVEG